MGKELEGQSQLNSADNSFIEFLEANTDQPFMTDIRGSLSMDMSQMMDRAQALLDRLEQYKIEPSKATPQVKKAWAAMDDFIASKAKYLQENGLTPIVYGSMAFDDAQYLDFDLCLVGMDDREDIEPELENWTRELAAHWKDIGVEGHMEYVSFEKLERYSRAFQENRADIIDEVEFDIFLDIRPALPVLIGTYAYSNPEEASKYKEKFLETVRQSPSLLAYTIWNIAQVLIDRETRRAGVFHHQTGEDRFLDKYYSEKYGIRRAFKDE